MREFLKAANKKVKEIQRSDVKTKKRWVILISGVSMAFVILFWIAYLNLTVPNITKEKEEIGIPFFSVLGSGFEIVITDIKRGFTRVSGGVEKTMEIVNRQIQKKNELNIEIKEKNSDSVGTSSSTINN